MAAPGKSAELVNYHAKLMDRIPATISTAYRMAIVEAIERAVDNTDPEDTNLRWRVQAAYHSNTEPASHEVVALALCFDSGALEGALLEVQKAFYDKNPKVAHHLRGWTLDGLVYRDSAAPAPVVSATVEHYDSDDNDYGNGCYDNQMAQGNAARVRKRKAADVEDLTLDDPKGKKTAVDPGVHIESENTPRLNQLARRPQIPEPTKTAAAVKVVNFARVPAGAPRGVSAAPAGTRGAETAAVIAANSSPGSGVSADRKEAPDRHVELLSRIEVLHAQGVDKLAHAETLRNEFAALAERRPVGDDTNLRGLNDFVTTSHGLSARALKCQEEAIRVFGEVSRLQCEHVVAVVGDIARRVGKVEKVVVGLGGLARRELQKRQEQMQNGGAN